jgi:hypothetical protein
LHGKIKGRPAGKDDAEKLESLSGHGAGTSVRSECEAGRDASGCMARQPLRSESLRNQTNMQGSHEEKGALQDLLESQHHTNVGQVCKSAPLQARANVEGEQRTQTRGGWRQVLRKRKLARVLLRGDQIVLIKWAQGPLRLPGCLAHLEPER